MTPGRRFAPRPWSDLRPPLFAVHSRAHRDVLRPLVLSGSQADHQVWRRHRARLAPAPSSPPEQRGRAFRLPIGSTLRPWPDTRRPFSYRTPPQRPFYFLQMYIAHLDPDSRGNRIDECDAIETSNKKAAPSFQGPPVLHNQRAHLTRAGSLWFRGR